MFTMLYFTTRAAKINQCKNDLSNKNYNEIIIAVYITRTSSY